MSRMLHNFIRLAQSKIKDDFIIKYNFILKQFEENKNSYLKNIFFEESNKLEFSKKFSIPIDIFNKINEMIEFRTDATNEVKFLENKIKEMIIKDVNHSYILPLLGYFYIARLNNESVNNINQDNKIKPFDPEYLFNWFIDKVDIDKWFLDDLLFLIKDLGDLSYEDGIKLLNLYCLYKGIQSPINYSPTNLKNSIKTFSVGGEREYDFMLWCLKYFYKNGLDITDDLVVYNSFPPTVINVFNKNSDFIIKYLEENIDSNSNIFMFANNIFHLMLSNKFPFPNKNSILIEHIEEYAEDNAIFYD